jgi:hypothetical protein
MKRLNKYAKIGILINCLPLLLMALLGLINIVNKNYSSSSVLPYLILLACVPLCTFIAAKFFKKANKS